MAHHIYHTKAFVIESHNVGEANKLFLLLTEDLGMIQASAQAVREQKSKLRFNLTDLSCIECSLVKGKGGWKITSAIEQYRLSDFSDLKISLMAKICVLLKRLVAGEEANNRLFRALQSGVLFLRQNKLSSEEAKNFECILVLAILHELGYVQKEIDFQEYVGEIAWSMNLLVQAQTLRPKLISQINNSLRESQM